MTDRRSMMAAPENNGVSWDALWRIMGGCAAVIAGAFAWLWAMIASNARDIKESQEAVYQALGNAASKSEVKLLVDGHLRDDDHRFEEMGKHLNRVQEQTRDDLRELGDRFDKSLQNHEEREITLLNMILTETKRNGK